MMTTYRAAYIPADPSSTGGGVALTTYEDRSLPDADLLEKARAEASASGATGEIVIDV